MCVCLCFPSTGPSPLTHSVSSLVSHLLQPPPTPSAPSWPRHWHYSLRPGLLMAMTPRCSPHLSSNSVTSCSALLWFLCCLDSES